MAHDVAQRRVFGVGETRASLGRWQEEIPQARGFCFRLELLDQACRLPAIALPDFIVEALLVGIDVSFHKCPKPVPQLDDLRRVVKIHGYPLSNIRAGRSSLVS